MAIDAAQQLALAASLAPKRISYTFPPTSPWHSLPRLELPNAPGAGRRTERAGRGSSNPIVNLHPQQPSISAAGRSTPSQHPRHALPVTSMAIDTSTVVLESLDGNTDTSTPRPSGILYTAARDGLVASWELNIQMKKKRPPSLRYSACTQLDNDGDGGDDGDGDGNKRSSSESGEESSLRQRSPEDGATFSQGCATPKGWAKLPVERQWEVDEAWTSPPLQGKPVSRFRSCVQSHTDWINDMLLCNFNMTVVTASSDRFVRLWNPHVPASCLSPYILGSHSDYVKALCRPSISSTSWLASGGLDQKLRLWDLSEMRRDPIVDITGSTSIYCLNTDSRGGIIAVGSPENGIRLYDPRLNSSTTGPVGKLLGHTDMVRSVLLSSTGRQLLSSSSDGTVRLWDVGEQRLLHTFGHHSASVTALFSDCDDLSVFYSADRDGVVCKVDFQGCVEPDEGECVVLAQTGGPVERVVALDDSFFWTCGSGSDVKCWRDIPKRRERQGLYPIHCDVTSRHPDRALVREADTPPHQWTTFGKEADKNCENVEERAQEIDDAQRTDTLTSKTPLSSAIKSTSNGSGQQELSPRPSASPTSPSALTAHYSHVSFAFSSDRSDSLRGGDATSITQKRLPIVPGIHPSATLFGIPFESLVILDGGDDPYGLGTGLGTTGGLMTAGSIKGFRGSTLYLASGSGPALHLSTTADGLRGSSFSLGRNSFALDGVPAASINMARLAQLRAASVQAAAKGSPSVQLATSAFTVGRRSTSTSIRFVRGEQQPDPLTPGYMARNQTALDDGDAALDGDEESIDEEADNAAMMARRLFEERDLAVKATPLRSRPEDIIRGTRGLIRSCMLNDRRHVLTYSPSSRDRGDGDGLDTNIEQQFDHEEHSGPQVALWDILRCRCLGIFYGPEIAALWEVHDTPGDILEKVRSHIEGFGATQAWCSVDTRNGSLNVHLEASSVFDAELYLDECEWVNPQEQMRPDQRVNIGKWLLRNLFAGFMQAETAMRDGPSPVLQSDHLAIEHPGVLKRIDSLIATSPSDSADFQNQREPSKPSYLPHIPRVKFENGSQGGTLSSYTPGNTIAVAVPARTPAYMPKGIVPLFSGSRMPLELHSEQGMMPSTQNQRSLQASDYFSFVTAALASGSASTRDRLRENVDNEDATPGSTTEEEAARALITTPSATTPGGGRMSRWGAKFRSKDKGLSGPSSPLADKDSPIKGSHATGQAVGNSEGSMGSNRLSTKDGSLDESLVAQVRETLRASTPLKPIPWSEAPPLTVPSNLEIFISAATGDAAQWQTIFRGLACSTSRDVGALEITLPLWLLEFLLANRSPSPKSLGAGKISLILFPEDVKNEQKRSRSPLPALSSGDAKLTATKMSRLFKVSQYICDKLSFSSASTNSASATSAGSTAHSRAASIVGGSRRPSAENLPASVSLSTTAGLKKHGPLSKDAEPAATDHGFIAPKDLVLICNGVDLDPYTTLIQVARFYWKSGGDVRIGYCRGPRRVAE